MNEFTRGQKVFIEVARGDHIEPGVNNSDRYVLEGRANAILRVADAPFARLAGAFVAEVAIPERHIPKAHRVLDFATRNLSIE